MKKTMNKILQCFSLAGHGLPPSFSRMYMYGATKNAVTQLAEGLRRELIQSNSNIRVTVSALKDYCLTVTLSCYKI